MAAAAQFAATPKVGLANISTANTNRDGTGTIGTVATAGASGTRLDNIDVVARSTTTPGMVRLFIHDGTTAWLWKELPVPANTPGANAPVWSRSLAQAFGDFDLPLVLPTGYSLRASTHNAESFNVLARGGDF